MPRFFTQSAAADLIELHGEQANHIRVLRLKPGDPVTLCDGRGTDLLCTLESSDSQTALLRVNERKPSESEPAVRLTVFMAFSKADKLEHVIQKATELGAAEIVAYPASRCVAKYDAATLAKKLPRWQKIADAAAEQSGRGCIPTVRVCDSFAQAVQEAVQTDLPLIFYENERDAALHRLAAQTHWQSAAIMTGPEGGYSEEEVRRAVQAGMRAASLGARILRCETAPLCALAALLFAAGEI